MKTIIKILKFIFGKVTHDCIDCVYETSTGHGHPCCECDGTKYYEDKREIL